MKKDESGHIVVETVGTFIPLVLLVISILSLVNIVAVQARIHYALTQSAMTISECSYPVKALNLMDEWSRINELGSIFGGINSVVSSGFSDINETVRMIDGMLNGVYSGNNFMVDALTRPLVERYLANGDLSGKEYLDRFNIVDFNLGSSNLMDNNENVKLTAKYAVEYRFGALPLPFGPKLRITQTAVTKAWAGGSGDGYH
jgi:hypothetical protein